MHFLRLHAHEAISVWKPSAILEKSYPQIGASTSLGSFENAKSRSPPTRKRDVADRRVRVMGITAILEALVSRTV